jgi:hypothetical protein
LKIALRKDLWRLYNGKIKTDITFAVRQANILALVDIFAADSIRKTFLNEFFLCKKKYLSRFYAYLQSFISLKRSVRKVLIFL